MCCNRCKCPFVLFVCFVVKSIGRGFMVSDEAHLPYQAEAGQAVVDVFNGQPLSQSGFEVSLSNLLPATGFRSPYLQSIADTKHNRRTSENNNLQD